MHVTVTGKLESGLDFSFSELIEPKEVASGVHKGEAKERDLGEVLQYIGQKILRNTEPMAGAERDKIDNFTVQVTN